MHQALAEVTDPERDPDRRAWHRAHAAVGPDEEVAAELEHSADRALARGGRAAAAAFLERAAELTPDPRQRAARILTAARARFDAGTPNRVPGLLAAAELAPLDSLQQAQAELLRAQVAFAVTHGRAAGPPLLAAARRLETLDRPAARETYLAAVGAALHAGRLGDDDLTRAARAARRMPAGDDVTGLLLSGLTTWVLDGYAPAVHPLRRALTALESDQGLPLLWLSVPVALEVWDDAAWFRVTERAVAVARATGAAPLLPTALTFRASALVLAGRFADASDLVDEAEALGQATGLALPPATALSLAVARGQELPARDLIDGVVRGAELRGEGRLLGAAGYARAMLSNARGEYAVAVAAALEAVEHDDLGIVQWALAELVEAAARTGETAVAAEARQRLAARTSIVKTNWALGAQAVADALAGPPATAEECYREAVSRLSATWLTLPLARARLLYGEWLRRENRRSEARTQLRAAHEAFATMGAEAFADRAGRELAATGETVRKRVLGAADELTAQEAQIARLAAAGRTNPEIGAVLFLSPRTVEWHLRKVFTKLGVASRRELAVALRDQ